MKKVFFVLIATLFVILSWAQSPDKMSYQAVIRNISDQLVINTQVGMQISILQGSTTGSAVYIETQTPTSNANGLISLEIGDGVIVSGDFSAIDWTGGPYYIKTETDPTGGTSYTITGTSELLSVPYALHASTADSLTGNYTEIDPVFGASVASGITTTDITSWDSKLDAEVDGSITNEIQVLSISNDTIYLSNGGYVKLPAGFDGQYSSLTGAPTNVSSFTNDAGYITGFTEVDGDISNEIQDLQLTNDTLVITNNTSATKIDLLPYKCKRQQTLVVALSGGDAISVCDAIDMLLGQGSYTTALSPAPSNTTPWVIEVKAGVYNETGTGGSPGAVIIPDYVSVRGEGKNATILYALVIDMSGTNSSLEDLKFVSTNTSSGPSIYMPGANYCVVKNVEIEAGMPAPLIDISFASNCEIIGNKLIGFGPMAAGGILMSNASYCRIEDNYIDLNNPMVSASTSGSFGISDNGINITACVISKNTIRYATTGISGPGPSYGIGLSGFGTSVVSYNIFIGGAMNKDIISGPTGNPPTWLVPGPGSHGVGNQCSNGVGAAAF